MSNGTKNSPMDDNLIKGLLSAIANLKKGSNVAELVEEPDVLFDIIEKGKEADLIMRLAQKPELVAVSKDGRSLLHAAVMTENMKMISTLVHFCADINKTDEKGRTPLDLCESITSPQTREAISSFLKSKGALGQSINIPIPGEEVLCSPDVGMTSYSRDVDISEPLNNFEEEWDLVEVPDVKDITTVSFTDPHTSNLLVFKPKDDRRMYYEIQNVARPPFERLIFVAAPPRLMFPEIGTCATLPDDNRLPQILGGIRYLASKCNLQHDISPQIRRRKEITHWNGDTTSLVIVMQALPGCGKTLIAQRLCRWLNWKGVRTRICFGTPACDKAALRAMVSFLKENSSVVGILGSFQSLAEDRKQLVAKLSQVVPKERVIFIDSTCDDRDLIRANILGMDKDASEETKKKLLSNYEQRVKEQLSRYQSPSEDTDESLSWIKLTKSHCGRNTTRINRITGHLPQKLLFFLLNLYPSNTTTYLVRTGECLHQVANKVGGNTALTGKGWQHAAALRRFFNLKKHKHPHMQVFSSTMERAVDTQLCFQGTRFSLIQYKSLNEINAAACNDLTPQEIKAKYPDLWRKRAKDKFHYGWPRGESYRNMNQRLEQVILDVHHSCDPVCIIGHLDVCRGLYAYMSEMLPELCVYLKLPQHHIYEFNYRPAIHKVEIIIHDISPLLEEAAAAGISERNRPTQEYLNAVPLSVPGIGNPPRLPAHVQDILTTEDAFSSKHQKSNSNTELPDMSSYSPTETHSDPNSATS
eukprot:TRINITY_DN16876_c0_g1_i1.p1 TRINITY_DN16876_c0_g1~~TRINITY_DN16876_c0_g1_i1.p1  ORF type:complete len:756 (+),score=115.13 TRINITY_DN16876_c0_g1_i1:69-2336(+)